MKRIKNYKLFLESFDEDENFKSKMDELKKHLFKVFENIFNMEKLIRSTGDMNKIKDGTEALIELLMNIWIDSVNRNVSMEESSKEVLILNFESAIQKSKLIFVNKSFREGIESTLEQFKQNLEEHKRKQDSEGEEWREEKETSYDDMTNSEIHSLIDQALDERDFDRVKFLSNYLKESFATDEVVESVQKFCEILLDFVISNNYVF